MYEAGICLLFYMLFYLFAVYCTCMWLALLIIILVILFGSSVLYMYVAGICLLFFLLFCLVAVYCTCMRLEFAYYSTCYFILVALYCTIHVRGWVRVGLISMMLITPDVFVGGFPAVPPVKHKKTSRKSRKKWLLPFLPGKNTHILLACSVSIYTVVDITRLVLYVERNS
jgi:hypothetical protein